MAGNVYKRVDGAWVADKFYQYQQNTATVENSTTIPIYSNGSNLTDYTFEGQCSQASTPTPSSPVEVEEFGDYISQSAIDNILTNCSVSIAEPYPDRNTSGVGRVTVKLYRSYVENSGVTILEAGGIYVKDVLNTKELILANVDGTTILKTLGGTTTGSKTVHVTDPEGKGVRVVSYAVVTDGTYVVEIYSQEAKATYQELKDEEEQGITVSHLYTGPDNVTHVGKYQIPITSNDTKQFIYLADPLRKIGEYADTVDSEGVVTRRIRSLVLNGTESWDSGSDFYRMNITGIKPLSTSDIRLCTHYVNSVTTPRNGEFLILSSILVAYLIIVDTTYNTVEDFKTFLAQQYANGTPVTVYYVLATPTTEVVTPPLGNNLVHIEMFTNDMGIGSNGKVTSTSGRIATVKAINVTAYDSIVVSFTVSSTLRFIYSTFSGNTLIARVVNNSNGTVIDVSGADKLYLCFYASNSIDKTNVRNLMVNSGSTALPYEPYRGCPTIPTSSGYSNIKIDTELAPSKVELDMGKMFVAKGQGKVRQNGAWT